MENSFWYIAKLNGEPLVEMLLTSVVIVKKYLSQAHRPNQPENLQNGQFLI